VLKAIYFLKRREGTNREQFVSYWQNEHASLTKKIPGLRKYVTNIPLPSDDGREPPWDGISELWFDDRAAMDAAFASPEGRANNADTPNYVNIDELVMMLVEERQQI
jgi:uncharacterized protein (TIGR02118 family)